MGTLLSDSEVLHHIAYNVFLPPQLPQHQFNDTHEQQINLELTSSVIRAARRYERTITETNDKPQWVHILRMLQCLSKNVEHPLEKTRLCHSMKKMVTNDVLALYITAQNAAVIVRKQQDSTVFETFEVQAPNVTVMSAPGKIVRQYPGLAVEVPNTSANDMDFISEISNFLAQMDAEQFEEATPTTRKAGSRVEENRDSVDPSYFIQLFLGILRGMGEVSDPPRVTKRIADEVLWKNAAKPWRRSPIWLIIRVALQTSLDSTLAYKHFMAYYHAYVIELCQKYANFSSDLLFTMRAKMARRLYKIEDSAPRPVTMAAGLIAQATQELLEQRWTQVQANQSESPERDLSSFDFDAATHQTLPNSRGYLEQVFKGRSSQQSRSPFEPKHAPRLANISEFIQYANGGLVKAFQADNHLALFDFEKSVYEHLGAWTDANRTDASSACKIISSCFQQYLSTARSYYTVDVADQSIMILTLMRLWMAIDQLATIQCPLLLSFSPEIPENMLEPLLLRSLLHIDQARKVQQHLRSRHAQALSSNHSVFSDKATPQSFAVQYFRQSPRHQSLKSIIESNARAQRDEKVRELKKKNAEHARLSRQAGQMVHGQHESQKMKARIRQCERCRIEHTRNKLKIQLHEWPLPARQHDAELVVFELERPEAFTIWRDTTYGILCDLGSMERSCGCMPYVNLEGYSDLRPWLSAPAGVSARIILASATKPFTKAHYASTQITATQERVCVNNGLQYKLYDKQKNSWAAVPFTGVTFAKFGTLKLPRNSSYQHLRYALEGTTHSSNQVLADQYDCPKELNLHEHIAYGTLRSGARLQWMNILRGLEENILTFSAEEVKLLHTQAAWQIGELSEDGSREWHCELDEPHFGELLVSLCGRLLKRVEASWLEANALLTTIRLVARLLATVLEGHVVQSAYKFLREARQVTLKWLNELQGKLQAAEIVSDIVAYQSRVCEMAAICRSTYDVDPHHVRALLEKSEDFTTLIKCSIILYDNQPPDLSCAPEALQILLCRDRRLAHRMVDNILQALRTDNDIICAPVSEIWLHYRAGASGWRELEAPTARWVSTTTAGGGSHASQSVHLNLLDGQLLVDGKPLGRLPREYVLHPTYLRLFGQKILDVVPARSPGMEFSTRGTVHGYEVSFARVDATNELIVQAHKGSQTFELVPHLKLSGDFPESLSSDYHHWADLESQVVEFRPIKHAWSSLQTEWLLRLIQGGMAQIEDIGHGSALLIDLHNPLFHWLACRIGPLESPGHLHIIRSAKNQMQVELPRMRLSFFINQEMQLESHNFRGQIVDPNQSSGTLFGLRNQLILRAKDPIACSLPRSRSILVPHGDIGFSKQGYHVSVTIQPGSGRQVRFHRYVIDTDLGYLASDSGLTSRLLKIYLHALTSHCLPDPLTGRTGTEEALSELSEPATSSFEQIDEEQANLLNLIGSLTPKREYYPPHLKCMQTTHWANLPALSQHFAFCAATSTVIDRAKTLQLFHPLDFKLEDFTLAVEPTLLTRASRRSSIYYPPSNIELLAQIVEGPEPMDRNSIGRDSIGRDSWAANWTASGQTAAWASRLVFSTWGQLFYKPYNLVPLLESWGAIQAESDHLQLTYNSLWLNLELPGSWISLFNLCRRARAISNKYALSMCLATAGFSQKVPVDLLAVLVAFATIPAFQHLAPPPDSSFDLADGYQPTHNRVKEIISTHARSFEDSPASRLGKQRKESEYDLERRRWASYDQQIQMHKAEFSQSLIGQWPSARPVVRSTSFSSWFRVDSCLTEVKRYFLSCLRNIELRNHLRKLEKTLSTQPASRNDSFRVAGISLINFPAFSGSKHPRNIPALTGLMSSRSCPDSEAVAFRSGISISAKPGPPTDTSRLSKLFDEFSQEFHPLNRRYGEELDESRRVLAKMPTSNLPPRLPSVELLLSHGQYSQAQLRVAFQRLQSALAPLNAAENVVFHSGIWPRVTPRILLKQLSLRSRLQMSALPKWHDELVDYARAFANYQRSQRLVALANSGSQEEFYRELNFESGGLDAEINNPDWLLVQIDGNFSMRSVQRQVAEEMIAPSSRANTVLQLNMGEGKSSVIVPIVAAALANTEQLVRVVVLKPLWRQMFHLLVNRLSGLAHRRIYYLPFGRHIRLDSSGAHQLQVLYDECMREGGIILTQPEHILSFKLMGIDHLISSSREEEMSTAYRLRGMQHWLAQHTRDILDESDEILYVRYQLVYTIGQQQPLEDHPDRWTTAQRILQLAASHIHQLQASYPESFTHEQGKQGQFPMIRIMPDCEDQTEQKLVHALAEDILAGRILNLNCVRLTLSVRELVVQFLTQRELPYPIYQELKRNCDPVMWKGLLLVRGLLALGIIIFALKNKHYRVDYGLDLGRSLLAVPYRAKDIPSLRAEFGHPDVAVVLTCLSYYYKGLTDSQLDHCFELLYKLDNPSLEYEQWVAQNAATPSDLRQLTGVNIKDSEQFRDRIIPTFSQNSAVVDFFLSSVVFPKAAKEFPSKLSTSGWDLAESKQHVTTGFSGTNDNRYLLPTSISQADPVKQLSTNALVLTYLLRPENNHYICMRDENGRSLSTINFLFLLVSQTPEIRVLLDVGAQMLELQNEELVRCWLKLRPDIEAAVYFNDEDELVALPQNGTPLPLYSSPFAHQLDQCIVYLDDGHTRGTDLKLPRTTRALVTLGPKVTKDRLLQGCMRMRKLGHGQSVLFAAPPEIDRQIRAASPKPLSMTERVDTLDVLRWAMLETCNDLRHHVSHWAQQAIEYKRRAESEQSYSESLDISQLRNGWIMPESRSLEEMYGIRSAKEISKRGSSMQSALGDPTIRERLETLCIEKLHDPGMDEEQEREVNHEIEREQQVERPPKATPAVHTIHQGVRYLIKHGQLPPPTMSGIDSLFLPLSSFGIQAITAWHSGLQASADFSQTLARSSTQMSDYMRPVNWVVQAPDGVFVALSPYEVNELLPLIRQSRVLKLHVYAPRVTRSMMSFSNLDFYSIPSQPQLPLFRPMSQSFIQLQLDIFAGQLYFSNYQDYKLLCSILGLYAGTANQEEQAELQVQGDGFVSPIHRERLSQFQISEGRCKFTASPVPMLRELIGRRRKGMQYLRTDVGQILHGRTLTPNDF